MVYEPNEWNKGDRVSATKLRRLEQGVVDASTGSGGGGASLTPEQIIALNDVIEGRLGSTVMDITGEDLNDYIETGNYRGNNLINAPLLDWAYLEVLKSADNYAMQRLTHFTGPAYAASWSRYLSNGTWSDWIRFDRAYMDSLFAPKTKSAPYTLGGTAGQGSFGAMTGVVRVPVKLPKKAIRMRVHFRNTVGLTDVSPSNGHSLGRVNIGPRVKNSQNKMAVRSLQTFPIGAGSLDNGGEYVTDWLVPNWDTSLEMGNLTYEAAMAAGDVALTYSAAGYFANTGVAADEMTGGPWQTYGSSPYQVWIEYDYEDDGSIQTLFLGDSIPDGYYGGPFAQTQGSMRNWQGHIDSFPEAWARQTDNVAVTNAYASAKIDDWGTNSSKWQKFATMERSFKPDAIVIHLGGNDFFNGGVYWQIVAEMEAWLVVVRTKYPDVPIYLVGCIPLLATNTGAGNFQERVYMNMGFAAIDKNLIDGYFEPDVLYDPTSGDSENALVKLVSPDLLHFTPQGYEQMARVINI